MTTMTVATRVEGPGSVLNRDGAGHLRPEPVVELAGVSVDVERTPVLRGVDLRIGAGEVVGVVGANGSGKTTLLRVLATLLPPRAGRGHVLGAALCGSERAAVRGRIALVGHGPALHPRLSLAENLRLLARVTGRPALTAEEALERVGLRRAGDRVAARCSQGMLRRADLARVWVTEPQLLLLDEPHAGLDAAATGLVPVIVAETRRRRGGCVVTSHDPTRLRSVVDRWVRISEGRVVPVVGM